MLAQLVAAAHLKDALRLGNRAQKRCKSGEVDERRAVELDRRALEATEVSADT